MYGKLTRTTSIHSAAHAAAARVPLPSPSVAKQLPRDGKEEHPYLSDAKDQKTSLYSGPQKVLSKSGHLQNVAGSTGKCGQTGSKDIGDETAVSTDGNSRSPTPPPTTPVIQTNGSNEILSLMKQLNLVKDAVPTTALNIKHKFYRFASDDSQIYPWSRVTYAAGPPITTTPQEPYIENMEAYLGCSNVANTASPLSTDIAKGGIGFTKQSSTPACGVSNDIALLLTKIPIATPTNTYSRIGPAIYIHKIHGKAVIKRHAVNSPNLAPSPYQLWPAKYPTIISYIQVEPIALEVTQTNYGTIPILTTGITYPQEEVTQISDFISYRNNSGITGGTNDPMGPYNTNAGTGGTWNWNNNGGSLLGPNSTDNFRYVHRTPEIQTHIHSYYHKVHSGGHIGSLGTNSGFNAESTSPATAKFVSRTDQGVVPNATEETFEVPIEHDFGSPGLKVVYDQKDTTGTQACINAVRWRYCQDMTGCMWSYTDNAQTALVTTVPLNLCFGYSETMSYEIWVEFSDVPTQL